MSLVKKTSTFTPDIQGSKPWLMRMYKVCENRVTAMSSLILLLWEKVFRTHLEYYSPQIDLPDQSGDARI